MTKAASSATFHGWKDVDLIVRSNVVEEDDDLNEGFCHYSIVDDEWLILITSKVFRKYMLLSHFVVTGRAKRVCFCSRWV